MIRIFIEAFRKSPRIPHQFGNDFGLKFSCTEFTEFFWTFPIVQYSKKHDVSETGSVSVLR
jgi:hypothetical protein